MRRVVTGACAALAILTCASAASAAPIRPHPIEAGENHDGQAVALAGPRVVWEERLRRRHQLMVSTGGKPRVLKRFNPKRADPYYTGEELDGLTGSKQVIAWQYSVIEDDDRLSYDVYKSVEAYARGKTRALNASCGDSYGYVGYPVNDGVDASGRNLGLGNVCASLHQLGVVDMSARKLKVQKVTGRYPTGGVRLAGRYIAWREFEFFLDRIVVYDWVAKRELYRFYPPAEAGLQFDLQDDGKVALSYQPDHRKALGRVGWLSPDEPYFHAVHDASDFSGVHMVGNRIAFTRAGKTTRDHNYPFVVSDLSGKIEYEIRAFADSFLEDFDGQCLAWLDTSSKLNSIMVSPVPALGKATNADASCGYVRFASSRVKRQGLTVSIPIQCRARVATGCNGRLKVAADGGVLAATKHFHVRPATTRSVRVRIPSRVLKTPHSQKKLRLRLAATVKAIAGVRGIAKRTVFATPDR